jgi:presenilin-like A22 family membrane protease
MVAPKMAEEPRTRIEHPNRGKASSQVTRLIVVLLLLVSVALMLIVTIGGWATLAGAKPVQLAYILLYLVLAFFVARWNRGVLPLIAALAIGLGIFAAISVPGWFARDHPGFTDPGLASDLLGLICALIAIVQLLLIFFAMSGFRQAWNVEVEKGGAGQRDEPEPPGGPGHRRRDEAAEDRRRREDGPSPAPA